MLVSYFLLKSVFGQVAYEQEEVPFAKKSPFKPRHTQDPCRHLGPLLLTRLNFNPSKDK